MDCLNRTSKKSLASQRFSRRRRATSAISHRTYWAMEIAGEYQPLPTAASKRTPPATKKENCLYSLAEREFSVSGLIRRDGEDARRGPTMFARISVARPPRSRPVTIRRATEKLRKEISSDDASARRPPWRSVG